MKQQIIDWIKNISWYKIQTMLIQYFTQICNWIIDSYIKLRAYYKAFYWNQKRFNKFCIFTIIKFWFGFHIIRYGLYEGIIISIVFAAGIIFVFAGYCYIVEKLPEE